MKNELAEILNRPLAIGNKTIRNRLALAPMTMLGNIAFRELLAGFGGYGLLFSEMLNAKRVPTEKAAASGYFRWREEERGHLVMQIYGAEPETMAKAAERIESEGIFGVDINFGCSVKPICSQNCGAAALKDPGHAEKIVSAVRRAVSIPLFVKFRTGWKDDPEVPVDLAKRFEQAGADALTFHPRVSPDRRSRPPKWEYIGRVKEAVSIPVFGNGNVFDAGDCISMLKKTGCDGIALGRLAVSKPWSFAEFSDDSFTPGDNIYKKTALRYADILGNHFEPRMGLRRFKKFALYFCANFRYGHTFYIKLKNANGIDEIKNSIESLLAEEPELCSRPNLNFFI